MSSPPTADSCTEMLDAMVKLHEEEQSTAGVLAALAIVNASALVGILHQLEYLNIAIDQVAENVRLHP